MRDLAALVQTTALGAGVRLGQRGIGVPK